MRRGLQIRASRSATRCLDSCNRNDRAEAAGRLRHPNIVTVYEFAEVEHVDLMVMEYLEGQVLSAILPKRGFPVSRSLVIAVQIADALCAAHEAGILHRDLKPSNVMVLRDDAVKLLDFGVAQRLDADDLGHSSREWGTRIYEDRRKTIRYVCEVPTVIERRLFALGRAIAQAAQ